MNYSVIIPVYNGETHLNECIESILGQTFKDYEIVLIDDGSTDKTGEIADSYVEQHNNIKVIHSINRGLLLARRLGISVASGDYIVFVDGDDCLASNALLTINEAAERYASDIVMYGFSRERDFTPSIAKFSRMKQGLYIGSDYETVKKYAIGGYMSSMWMKAVRRRVYDSEYDYEDYAGLMHGEDLLQTLPIVDRAESLYMLDSVLYYYRPNEESSTAKFNRKQLIDIGQVNKRLLEYGRKWGLEHYNNALIGEVIQYINILTIICESNVSKGEKHYQCMLLRDAMASNGVFERAPHEKLRIDHRAEIKSLEMEKYARALNVLSAVKALKKLPGIR